MKPFPLCLDLQVFLKGRLLQHLQVLRQDHIFEVLMQVLDLVIKEDFYVHHHQHSCQDLQYLEEKLLQPLAFTSTQAFLILFFLQSRHHPRRHILRICLLLKVLKFLVLLPYLEQEDCRSGLWIFIYLRLIHLAISQLLLTIQYLAIKNLCCLDYMDYSLLPSVYCLKHLGFSVVNFDKRSSYWFSLKILTFASLTLVFY